MRMQKLWRVAMVVSSVGGLAGGSVAGAAGYKEFSFGNLGGFKALHSWCDTPGRVLAVSAPAQVDPVTPQPVTFAQWVSGAQTKLAYQLGPQDAGAGQLYTTLTPAGQAVSQTPTYFIHSSNIENTVDPSYRMTHINEYRVPAGTFRCRYVPQAAVLAATAKHSVVVWERAGQVTYSSTNRNGTPGVYLTGGTHTQAGGRERYTWARGEYEYVLEVGGAGRPGGVLLVRRGGVVQSRFPLLAYTISVPK